MVPILVMAALTLAVLPSTALAVADPIGYTAFGGFYSGGLDEWFLGAGVRVGLAGVTVIPNAEYIFVDNGTALSLNADATFPIVPLGVAAIYGGGGLGFEITDPENSDSHTETVINLIAGAGLNALPMKPYGQIKHVFVDGDDPWVFAVGVRF